MPGGLLQLSVYGEQDLYLTGNPQITYFIAVYKRHTNFAIESVQEFFNGTFDFGQKCYCVFTRVGDLIHRVYLWVRLPAINNQPDPKYTISWINGIGHALIKRVEIEIGGVVIDTQYGQWLEIWSELTVHNNKRDAYNDMVGRFEYFNSTMQQGGTVLYIPLQFWFCRNIGLSLPLVAIQNHQVRLLFDVANFNELWTSSNGQLRLSEEPHIEEAFIYADHIFLESEERRAFVQKRNNYYLIEQLQIWTQSLDIRKTENQIHLEFTHPVKELIWVIQNDSGCQIDGANMFNFSDRLLGEPGEPEDPMLRAKMQIEGRDLFNSRIGKYFRMWVPYAVHTRVPGNFIYVFSFSFDPEAFQPTGHLNMSRIDDFTIVMEVKDTLTKPIITIYAVNYNILDVTGGMAGVVYKN